MKVEIKDMYKEILSIGISNILSNHPAGTGDDTSYVCCRIATFIKMHST